MRIIFEETEDNHFDGKRRVEIEWTRDDMTIFELREKLLEPALLALTYQPCTIAELFNENIEEDDDDEEDEDEEDVEE